MGTAGYLLWGSLVFDLQSTLLGGLRLPLLLNYYQADWFSVVIENQTPASAQFDMFKNELRHVFDHPDRVEKVAAKLLSLRQVSTLVPDNSIQFRILAVDSGWNDSTGSVY